MLQRKSYLKGGSVYCAAGSRVEEVWDSMRSGRRQLSPLACPGYRTWPWKEVFSVPEPDLSVVGVERRLSRMMEKQAKLGIYGASLALRDRPGSLEGDRTGFGLFLGMATVEEAVPPLELLESLRASSTSRLDSALLLREVPAFYGLSTLNSNLCAHITGTFGLMGAMGAYSPHADAGLQALIDGALSLEHGENDRALIGGIAPKINPFLLLQYEHLGWTSAPWRTPGEGAAFVQLDSQADSPGAAYIRGFGRGFIADPTAPEKDETRIIQTALGRAQIDGGQIDWVLAGEGAGGVSPECRNRWVGNPGWVTGHLGPAGPVLHALLAAQAIGFQQRLQWDPGQERHVERSGPVNHVLVTAAGPGGQFAAVVISREEAA